MKNIFVVIGMLLTALLLVGCSSQKALWGNEKDGFVLTYRMAPNAHLSYTSTGKEKMSLTIMGSDQGATTTSKNDYTVVASESEDDNLNLTVTIDNFVRESSSQNGDFSVDASPILAKDFQLVLSSLGKEIEFNGVEKLKVDLGPEAGGIQDVKNYYQSLFPDLPEHPVKIGESWITEEEFTAPAGNLKVVVKAKNTHTLAGLEIIDGKECLKISLVSESVITGKGEQDGMDLDMTSSAKGTGTWYFAYKKGLFVKSEGITNLEGSIEVSGDFAFSIPITQQMTSTVGFVK